jgi:hypothetical protein
MQANSKLPPSEVLVRRFAERRSIKFTDVLKREELAIRTTSIANILLNAAYRAQDDENLADPAVGLLLNMLHRNFEHIEASIVAFVTGCGTSAEVIARAATESSVNILYIVAGDRVQRLQAYFDHYLIGVDSQVEKWQAQIRHLSPQEAAIHKRSTERRRLANDALRRFLRSVFGNPEAPAWPKTIAQRFEALGDALAYRTFYARMSSEIHADAEETLRYFLGHALNDQSKFEAMALETIWMSRFLIRYAVSLFLKASMAYTESYSMAGVKEPLRTALTEIEKELVEISSHIGA